MQDYTYWSVLGCFKNWSIITFSNKTTTCEEFEDICQVFIDGISDNIKYLVYGTMNTTYASTLIFYVVKYISEDYILQEDTTCYGEISTADQLVVKSQYLI